MDDHQAVNTQTTNLALSETHTFSPRLLNTVLIGMQRYATTFDESEPFPVVTISGLNFSPGNRGLYGREPTDIQAGDSLTLVKGRHTLKAGVTVWRIDEPYHGFSGGSSVTFTSIQNFLSDVVTSASISPTVPGNTTYMTQLGAYVTDTWQVRPGLTVDLGLRWDWNQVPHDNWATEVWSNQTNSLTSPGAAYFNNYYKNLLRASEWPGCRVQSWCFARVTDFSWRRFPSATFMTRSPIRCQEARHFRTRTFPTSRIH